MVDSARRLLLAVAIVCVSCTLAFAQGGGQSLSGTVVDAGGGVIPGATVSAKNNATGQAFEVVSNESGLFSIPGIGVGTYTVTVTLSGFKTAVMNEVRIVTATQTSVKAVLEIGALNETIEVSSRAELVQSQSATVSSTLVAEQLNEVPLSSRNALYALNMLPGVQAGSGGGPRAAGINGLPNNTINITIDGVGTGNMLQSTDGFFSMVTPRLDAIEEITVTGAVPGAGAGPGSVQIQFATRSGTNRLDGSVYHYWRQPEFNSNYYFNKINNLAKNEVVAHQYRLPPGRPDRDSGALRRPQQGVLLLQLRAPVPAVERDAHPHDPAARRTGRRLRLQRHRRRRAAAPDDRPGGAGAQQRPDFRIRSHGHVDPEPHPRGDGHHRHRQRRRQRQHLRLRLPGRRHQQPVRAHVPRRHQPVGQAPPERLLSLAAVHERSRPAQQRRPAIPGVHERRAAELVSHHRQLDAPFDALGQPRQRDPRRLAVVAQRILRQRHGRSVRRSGWLRDRLPDRDERCDAEQSGPAQHHHVEHRQHVELAQGGAQLLDGWRLRRHPEPAERLQRGHGHHAWVRPEHRSGVGAVQHDELPQCHGQPADRSAQPVRAPHRPRLGDPRHRPAQFRHGQVRLQRRPGAVVEAVELLGVLLGSVARQFGPDPECRPALGLAQSLHAGGQHVVDRDA